MWSDEVRVCLMQALLHPRLIPGMTCDKLAAIAFHSHVECYEKSGDGFCDIIKFDDNFDALYDSLKLEDFMGKFGNQAKLKVGKHNNKQ